MKRIDRYVSSKWLQVEFIKSTDWPISASTRPSSSRYGGGDTEFDTKDEVSDYIPWKRILDYGIEELENVDQIRLLMLKEQQ